MQTLVETSYAYCHKVAKKQARNFYYGFALLPRPRRNAFCALYAFMRYCDDIADGTDSTEDKAAGLKAWRAALDRTLSGDYRSSDTSGSNLILPAFHHTVETYKIPPKYFYDLIDGAEMDLEIQSYRTFDDLYQYCYRVASVVGLCSLHVFGFRDPAAIQLAEECGIAFQLTNILRDIAEDAQTGRVYLPAEDLERFQYTSAQISEGLVNSNFLQLMSFEIERARSYYSRSYPLIKLVEAESRPALWTLIRIYRGILDRIASDPGRVLSHRTSLTDFEKLGVLLHAATFRLRYKAGLEPEWQRFN